MDANETIKGIAATIAIIGLMYLIERCAPKGGIEYREMPFYYKHWFRPCKNCEEDELLHTSQRVIGFGYTIGIEDRVIDTEAKEEH